MCNGQFGPGLIDHGMEESEFEMILDGNVFGEAVGFLGGRLGQDILSIEA